MISSMATATATPSLWGMPWPNNKHFIGITFHFLFLFRCCFCFRLDALKHSAHIITYNLCFLLQKCNFSTTKNLRVMLNRCASSLRSSLSLSPCPCRRKCQCLNVFISFIGLVAMFRNSALFEFYSICLENVERYSHSAAWPVLAIRLLRIRLFIRHSTSCATQLFIRFMKI